MRLELERRLRIRAGKIFKEFLDMDEDLIDEGFGGRRAHKKKKVRVIKERIVRPEDLDLQPTKTGQGLLSLMDNLDMKELVKKDEKYVWYPEIGKHLVDATKSMAKDEDKVVFDETKKTALTELGKRIPQINKIINEFKFQIYWAGKVLNGFNGPTPFDDPIKAMNFLKDTLKIDKNGVDKRKEEVIAADEQEPSQVRFGNQENFSRELERIILESETADTPQLSEDDPLVDLVDVADNKQIQTLASAIDILPVLEKANQRLILQAAIECLKNKTQKNTEGRWRSIYRPLLLRLGVEESVLGTEVV